MDIFHSILESRSFTAISYKCEDALLAQELPQGALDTLIRILRADSLDERYALAHEHLGEHEKAAELRQWIAGAADRRRQAAQNFRALF